MKRASLLERLRFSYSYALLHELLRSPRARLRKRRRVPFAAMMPAIKLERR